jgi:hypothetical protein
MHALQEDLELYIKNSGGQPDRTALVAHLTECEECQRRLGETAVRQGWNGNERRFEGRVPKDAPARVKVLEPILTTAPSGHAWIVDVSAKGVKLRVSEWVRTGAVLQMRLEDNAFALGEVRYCLPVGKEFYIGVRLLEAFPRA